MKNILKSKSKAGKSSGATIAIILGVILVVGILGYVAFFKGPAQTEFGNQNTGNNGNGGTTIVTTNPTISFSGQQAQNVGQAVNVGYLVSVNGGGFTSTPVASGTGTAVPGQSDVFLINATGYHSKLVMPDGSPLQITPSVFPYTVQLDKNASVTEVINYPYSGLNIGNNDISKNNITNSASNGASYILTDNMYGTSQASTNDMICLYEVTSGVNLTSTGVIVQGNGVTADAKYANSIPAFYTAAGVNSRVWAFDVPAIKSSASSPMTITLQTLATKSIQAGDKLIKTCYTKEWVIDSATGQPAYEVADSQTNTVDSLAQYYFKANFYG
jgi:hypothetical protein